MSASTTVRLVVLTTQAKAAEGFFRYKPDEDNSFDDQSEYTFYEVNYGNLPFLKNLEKAGIAYDSSWSNGNDYGPGTESLRFNAEGKPIISTLYDDGINPPLYALMALIDKPDELRSYLVLHQEKVADRPWDNQEEYGKVYMAKQLINPK